MEFVDFAIIILFAHFIADFMFQFDDVAQNKSSSNWVLTRHITEYSTVLGLIMFLALVYIDINMVTWTLAAWLVLNGALHWITDFYSSRAAAWCWHNDMRYEFFVVVGADQFIHAFCLLYSFDRMMM